MRYAAVVVGRGISRLVIRDEEVQLEDMPWWPSYLFIDPRAEPINIFEGLEGLDEQETECLPLDWKIDGVQIILVRSASACGISDVHILPEQQVPHRRPSQGPQQTRAARTRISVGRRAQRRAS